MGIICSKHMIRVVPIISNDQSPIQYNGNINLEIDCLIYQNLNQSMITNIVDCYIDNKQPDTYFDRYKFASRYLYINRSRKTHDHNIYNIELINILSYFNNLDIEILHNIQSTTWHIDNNIMKLMIKNINKLNILGKMYINGLPYFIYNRINNEDSNECPICLAEFKSGDNLKKLPCGHLFHKNCIQSWFIRKMICPNCKTSVIDIMN